MINFSDFHIKQCPSKFSLIAKFHLLWGSTGSLLCSYCMHQHPSSCLKHTPRLKTVLLHAHTALLRAFPQFPSFFASNVVLILDLAGIHLKSDRFSNSMPREWKSNPRLKIPHALCTKRRVNPQSSVLSILL